MSTPIRPVLAAVTLLAAVSMACSDGSGPSQPKGMSGTWHVTVAPFSTSNGRGSCQLAPSTFNVTIDSTSPYITATISTGTLVHQLLCSTNGDVFALLFSDTLSTLTDSTGSHPAFTFQVGDSTSTEYLVFGVPAQINGNSIASGMLDLQTVPTQTIGGAAWTATRQ
jgi:hypothetical protein